MIYLKLVLYVILPLKTFFKIMVKIYVTQNFIRSDILIFFLWCILQLNFVQVKLIWDFGSVNQNKI